MLKELEALVEAEDILNRIQLEVWKETKGPAWTFLLHVREHIRRRQEEVFCWLTK